MEVEQLVRPAGQHSGTRSSFVGEAVQRVEDLKIVKGKAGYTDDFEYPDQHYAAFLRSPYAHAKIVRIDTSKALALPGVKYVLDGKELARHTSPIESRALRKGPTSHYLMAVDKVRYNGEPVAAVVATNKYVAADALDLIDVEYEPLPPVPTIEAALKPGATLLYDELGTNELQYDHFNFGDVDSAFNKAAHVIKEKFKIHRYASTPLENYVVSARYDDTKDELVVYANDQQPGRTLKAVANALGLPASRVRLVVPIIGGGFGFKLAIWQYITLVSLLSMLSHRPVKWVQTRSESLYGPHRPAGEDTVELALSEEGKILGMKVDEYLADANWPWGACIYSLGKLGTISGPYKIGAYSFSYHSIATNQAPVVQDKGVGKPYMNFMLERMMEIAAKKLKVDSVEIRRRNFIQPDDMPYTTPSGEFYEGGNYPKVFSTALELGRYNEWKEKLPAMRKDGKYVGIGIAYGLEPGTSGLVYYYLSKPGELTLSGAGQMATVEMTIDGKIKTYMNGPEIGTGHATSLSQVMADMFSVKIDDVIVDLTYDSAVGHLSYAGTYGNGYTDVYMGAYIRAASKLKAKLLRIASHRLGRSEGELEFKDGTIFVKSDSSKTVTLEEVASIAYSKLLSLPPGEEPGLKMVAGYVNPTSAVPFRNKDNQPQIRVQLTHANSTHVAVVEVDPKTGSAKILDYAIVHDAGRIINPKIADGLLIGSCVSGIGGTLYEQFVFDENGNNLCVTFGEYLKPTSLEAPDIRIGNVVTETWVTALGNKSVGEGGALASLPAVTNAIEDALSQFNPHFTELPLTPERLWGVINKR